MIKTPEPQAEIVIAQPYPDKYEFVIYTATAAARQRVGTYAQQFGFIREYHSHLVLEVSKVYNRKEVERYLLKVCTEQTVSVDPPRIAEAFVPSLGNRLKSILIRIFPVRKDTS